MFDIGFLELLLIGIVALIVVGPERLPSLVKTTGLWVSRMRRMISGVKREITDELRIEELRQQAKAREDAIKSEVDSIRKPFSDTLRDDVLGASTARAEAVQPESVGNQIKPDNASVKNVTND